VAPEDLEDVPLVELRLIDPHLEGYVRHAAGGQVAVCQACSDQLDALAGELEAYRRRLLRTWPTPQAHRAAPREDQCLSRPFEALRDTGLPLVLGSAIWHARQGATASLIVRANGEWSIKAVPSGETWSASPVRPCRPIGPRRAQGPIRAARAQAARGAGRCARCLAEHVRWQTKIQLAVPPRPVPHHGPRKAPSYPLLLTASCTPAPSNAEGAC